MEDLETRFAAIREDREQMPERMGRAIADARTEGWTWQQIADALGITHSGAIQAHQRWKEQNR